MSNPLEMELQVAVSHLSVGAGTRLGSSVRTVSFLKHQAISRPLQIDLNYEKTD